MKKIVLPLFLVVILIAGTCLSGCASTAPATAPGGTMAEPAATAAQPVATAVTAGTAAPVATATVPAMAITTIPAAPADLISVTINSAVQKTQLGTVKPKEGNVFLVLDVTLHNNDRNEDFAYTPDSFQIIANNPGSSWHGPVTTVFTSGLDHQIRSGRIPLKSDLSGQIVFGASANANSFKFSVRDSKGNEVTRVDDIRVS
jgi:hypothetical protein